MSTVLLLAMALAAGVAAPARADIDWNRLEQIFARRRASKPGASTASAVRTWI